MIPLPWRVRLEPEEGEYTQVYIEPRVATMFYTTVVGRETAEHIVLCVKTHDELVAALRDLIAASDALIYRPAVDDSHKIDQATFDLQRRTNIARAALAKVNP